MTQSDQHGFSIYELPNTLAMIGIVLFIGRASVVRDVTLIDNAGGCS